MQITILGMGQVGASIGLALAQYKDSFTVVGYDKNIEQQNLAKKIGACSKTYLNLLDAVQSANLILLAVPYGSIAGLLEQIKDEIQPGAVILTAAPNKKATTDAFRQILPDGQIVGLTISFNPDFARVLDPGELIERDDLFQNTTIGISAPSGTNETALKYASDLVTLLGAKVYYLDILEADGIERSSYLLPQLSAHFALGATILQPGWNDTRYTVSQPYLNLAAAYGFEPGAELAKVLIDEKENNLRMLDQLLSQASQVKELLQSGDEAALATLLDAMLEKKKAVVAARNTGNWVEKKETNDDKSKRGFFRRFFFGDKKK